MSLNLSMQNNIVNEAYLSVKVLDSGNGILTKVNNSILLFFSWSFESHLTALISFSVEHIKYQYFSPVSTILYL